ncbi:Probable D,D-dipeptide transport system permease protein ddpC [Raoultella ornithinolytica]|nr:Probable D,D-dipeptide transport system permease protein ddpC [Raoultella ornithinolytica]
MIAALLMALAPQLFSGYNPLEGTSGAQRLAPQVGHWLGTDQLGRDLWTRIVYGAVHSLSAALAAVRYRAAGRHRARYAGRSRLPDASSRW